MACCAPGEGKARIKISKRDYISPAAINKSLHRIKGATMSRIFGNELFGFSRDRRPFSQNNLTIVPDFQREGSHFIFGIGNESANRAGLRAKEMVLITEHLKKYKKLFLA